MRALLAAALLLLLPGAAVAQGYDDSLWLVARDAFTLLVKSSLKTGITGKRTLTLAVLVGR